MFGLNHLLDQKLFNKIIEDYKSRTTSKAFVEKITGTFCFKLSGGPGGQEGVYIVDVKNGNGAVKFSSNGR